MRTNLLGGLPREEDEGEIKKGRKHKRKNEDIERRGRGEKRWWGWRDGEDEENDKYD